MARRRILRGCIFAIDLATKIGAGPLAKQRYFNGLKKAIRMPKFGDGADVADHANHCSFRPVSCSRRFRKASREEKLENVFRTLPFDIDSYGLTNPAHVAGAVHKWREPPETNLTAPR